MIIKILNCRGSQWNSVIYRSRSLRIKFKRFVRISQQCGQYFVVGHEKNVPEQLYDPKR